MRPSGIRRLFRFPTRARADVRRDVNDEIHFHLEMRTAELVAGGLSAADARAQALSEFGSVAESSRRPRPPRRHRRAPARAASSRLGRAPRSVVRAAHRRSRHRLHHRRRADARGGDRRQHGGLQRHQRALPAAARRARARRDRPDPHRREHRLTAQCRRHPPAGHGLLRRGRAGPDPGVAVDRTRCRFASTRGSSRPTTSACSVPCRSSDARSSRTTGAPTWWC